MYIFEKVRSVHWGAKSLVALYLSVFSGIVIALQYDPSAPFYSASSLDILVPFGAFWRSLHFYASQLFFIFLICHLVVVILSDDLSSMSSRKWILLIFTWAVSLLLLFTGYVLRADSTGTAAGAIAENIVMSVPFLGKYLNSLLFSISESGMGRVYANHVVGLCVLWLFLCWDHLRRYSVNWRNYPVLVIGTIIFCAIFNGPIEPGGMGVFYISGPWFFMGLQETLRYVQPFWAGIFWPSLLILSLILIHPQYHCRKQATAFTSIWVMLYFIVTLVAYFRS